MEHPTPENFEENPCFDRYGLAMDLAPSSFGDAVEARLALALSPATGFHPAVLAAARALVFAPGAKRARPMLVETLARLTRLDQRAAVDFAAAVELIHTASLLHDDVIDGADVRRSLPTANALLGNAVAVLGGDFVLTAALGILKPWGAAAVDRAVATIGEMTAGVADEVLARGVTEFSPSAWRIMAERKTGALFGLAAWLVAWPEARADRFDVALRHLGVAFQIADDAAEIQANCVSEAAVSQDLVTANPNYPVAVALDGDPMYPRREALASFWRSPVAEPAAVQKAALAVAALGGLAAAREAIAVEVTRGRAAFGFDVEHEAVQVVLNWADTLVAF